jgi:hypothetical protein
MPFGPVAPDLDLPALDPSLCLPAEDLEASLLLPPVEDSPNKPRFRFAEWLGEGDRVLEGEEKKLPNLEVDCGCPTRVAWMRCDTRP